MPLEVSPGRQATCRAVFGTWGFSPDDARASHYPFVLTSFTGAAPAKGFRAHVGGHKVALYHTPRSAEQACQPMGHTGGSVAGPLLGSDAGLQDGERRKGLSVRGCGRSLPHWAFRKRIVALRHIT